MAPRTRLALLLAPLAAAACAHAQRAAPPLPDVVWPEAPEAPRVRLAALFPDPSAPAPSRSRLRALLDLVAGVDEEQRRREGTWLARPFGVAALADGSFAIADPDLPAVLRVGPRGAVARVTCAGREWSAPMAAAAGPDGALWIADGGSGEVVRVAPDGRCRAVGAGALERPTGLVVEADRLLVVDPPRHEVVALGLDGAVLGRFGGLGDGAGQLHFPVAIARTPDGALLVVDALNFRVARFAADGTWLGAFGAAGQSDGELARPKGIAVDPEGRIYVSDAQRDEVLVYSPGGAFEAALSRGGEEPGQLTMPAGLAVAGRRLFVADSQNHRVQVFEILGGRP
jgi:sugar lactone lactonase YvrE